MNILIFGMGYVGTSIGLLLSRKNSVTLVDIDEAKVKNFENGVLPISDKFGEEYFRNNKKDINAVFSGKVKYDRVNLVIIATPTDFDINKGEFDTYSVENIIENVQKYSKELPILVKSTVPIGFTSNMNKKFRTEMVLFSPEFLREGNAVYDNFYPSRIIIGGRRDLSEAIAGLFLECSEFDKVSMCFCKTDEAEAIKLLTNTYLAARVSFFNEIDSMCMQRNLSTKDVIDGICLDQRIGNYYNNPSFGFGGYCLPKDSKQAAREFRDLDSPLIDSINKSNDSRKKIIIEKISKNKVKTIGIYKLAMKKDSDNFRSSAIIDILKGLSINGFNIIIHDQTISNSEFMGYSIVSDLDEFKKRADLIVCNRFDEGLSDVEAKVFSRDIYGYL